ncbi:hypothetical protein D1816_10285 [Aquimarina sp. AD10]|uniref:hypothetical protein n=1 Tax=Aquimarina sp. AD10 TaxID=1714849 RepID=UPI000E477140|nr:hypothetical protein [Aquimarina sp. AD10]AXT60719.1 hypothetical protein D1816_10285 [Aquimarina sp. AD10]RKM95746.1 hypothetical protein D7033_16310 [Aquimarina sp. AD10]
MKRIIKNVFKLCMIAIIANTAISCDKDDDNDNVMPQKINAVTISKPKPIEGNILNLIYAVSDFTTEDYINNKKVTITWWRIDDINDNNSKRVIIPNESLSQYTLKSEDIGKYIEVQVTVKGAKNLQKTSKSIGPIKGKDNADSQDSSLTCFNASLDYSFAEVSHRLFPSKENCNKLKTAIQEYLANTVCPVTGSEKSKLEEQLKKLNCDTETPSEDTTLACFNASSDYNFAEVSHRLFPSKETCNKLKTAIQEYLINTICPVTGEEKLKLEEQLKILNCDTETPSTSEDTTLACFNASSDYGFAEVSYRLFPSKETCNKLKTAIQGYLINTVCPVTGEEKSKLEEQLKKLNCDK